MSAVQRGRFTVPSRISYRIVVGLTSGPPRTGAHSGAPRHHQSRSALQAYTCAIFRWLAGAELGFRACMGMFACLGWAGVHGQRGQEACRARMCACVRWRLLRERMGLHVHFSSACDASRAPACFSLGYELRAPLPVTAKLRMEQPVLRQTT